MGWLIGEYWHNNDMDLAIPNGGYDGKGNGAWNWLENFTLVMKTPSGKRIIREGDIVVYDPDKMKFFRDLDYLELYKEDEL